MSNFGNFGKMSKKGVVSALFSFRKVGIPTLDTFSTFCNLNPACMMGDDLP